MTKLIIYIDSEQKASAYRIEEDNSYLISFNGNEYESDLPTFAEIVMDELRATPLSKMESRGGISVLLVSNGAANETIRKIMELLFHDDNEDGMLNVNIQELNVIEAKYFLPLIGNPEVPSAKDFANIYSIETSSFIQQKELEDLKSDNSILLEKVKIYEEKFDKLNIELTELREFKKETIKKEDDKIITQKKEEELSESIYKIDFMKDAENSGVVLSIPKNEEVTFFKRYKNGAVISQGSIIASYRSLLCSSGAITITAKKSGRIYYMVNDNSKVKNGDIIAVIGENTWTKDDAVFFLKQNQNSDSVKKNENEPVIVKADVIRNFVSEDNLPVSFFYEPLCSYNSEEEIEDGFVVSKNQLIMKIKSLFGNHEFEIKTPCDGKIFFLVPTTYEALSGWNTNITAEKSLAMIVPKSWSKSQAVEWYRSVEPLKEPVELTVGEITKVKNLFPDGAFVLPNDSYIDGYVDTGWSFISSNYTTTAYCCVAGRIRYKKQSAMNTSYYFYGGTIAEIY